MCRRWVLLVALASLPLCSQEQRPVNSFSTEKEAVLGASLATGVRKSVTIVDSTTLTQYVEQVGAKLIAVLPTQSAVYKFTIVTNDLGGSTHEPLALPGGAIFVPAQLIQDSLNEAEFAGMLAHAIAHVAARHGTRLATRAQSSDLAFSPVMYSNLGSPTGEADSLRNMQSSFEVEADQMTVGMVSGAGYDPEAFAGYVAREQKDADGVWSPLPPRDERVARIQSAIRRLPQTEFQLMLEEVHRLLTAAKVN